MKKGRILAAFILLLCSSGALFGQVTVTTSSLPNGRWNVVYAAPALQASGGTTPYTWSIVSGALPTGLALSSNGVITGTPTATGAVHFRVRATDSTPVVPLTGERTLTIRVPPEITTTALANGAVNISYSETLTAAPTISPPLSWSVGSGSLPTGLSVTSGTGVISGTPTTAGTFNFTITATDSSVDQVGGPAPLTGSKALSITIQPVLTITTSSPLPLAVAGVFYVQSLQATGPTPVIWSVVTGILPPGINLSNNGTLTGTPTTAGTFDFTVQARAGNPQQTTTKDLRLVVNPALSIPTVSPLPTATVGIAYSATLTAVGGQAPYTWSLVSGPLPPGISLSTSGVLSGTPTVVGNYQFAVQASDSFSPAQVATRALALPVSTSLTITTSSLPNGSVGFVYGPATLSAAPGTLPFTWSIASGSLPTGLSLSTDGIISGTPTATGTFSFTLSVTDSGSPAKTATKALTITIQTNLTITTSSLPPASPNTAYGAILSATGGVPPYTWAATSTLPPGLTLSSSGVISGTPTTAGNFAFGVQVTDSFSPAQTVSRNLTIAVGSAFTFTITTTSLPSGAVGRSYSQGLAATGGVAPFAFSIAAGVLPIGLTMGSDGVITGTPAAAGTYNFNVNASDSSVSPQTASRTFTITIQAPLTITTSSALPLAVGGAFYSQLLEATGPTPVIWSIVSGIAPPGTTLTSSGSLAGTPQVAGTYEFTVQARAGDPVQTDTRVFRIVVNEALLIVTAATLPDAILGNPYSRALEARGGLPPYTWTNPGRGLPPGLTLSTAGEFSGTPTGVGVHTFTIQVTDSFNPPQQATRTFQLGITTSLSITTASLPNALQNTAYSQQLQVVGIGPFIWFVTGGTLPAGLTLSTTGLLQGTPVGVGPHTFTVSVTDSRGAAALREFVLVVDPPIPALSASGLPATLPPTQMSPIAVTLAAPYPSPITGTLKLSFVSNAENPSDDPMTRFSSGSRTASFMIPADTTTAVFNPQLTLLTGTVAGTVRLTASIDNGPVDLPVATVDIPASGPQITNVTAVRTAAGLDVQITGYAPSRRITNVEFSFDVKSGNGTERVTLSRSVESEFTTWYRNPVSTAFGSSFSFLQSFAIAGDVNAIEGVSVRLMNAQGSVASSVVRPN